MDDNAKDELVRMVVAPYIQKATALIGMPRKVGGNQFRHMMATFAILIDYHFTNTVLLKASLIHDLFEDIPDSDRNLIIAIDSDGYDVMSLVDEVTKSPTECKSDYLKRLLERGSEKAKILKVADRISNLTDMHPNVIRPEKMKSYLNETMLYVYPMAVQVNAHMAIEIEDLVHTRERYIHMTNRE
ncbi:MAG: hypothetical protein PHT69_05105 [Bacteroidales bacterium]|nr:hypothetical protein [Bacteroidales bacterium]